MHDKNIKIKCSKYTNRKLEENILVEKKIWEWPCGMPVPNESTFPSFFASSLTMPVAVLHFVLVFGHCSLVAFLLYRLDLCGLKVMV